MDIAIHIKILGLLIPWIVLSLYPWINKVMDFLFIPFRIADNATELELKTFDCSSVGLPICQAKYPALKVGLTQDRFNLV